MILTASKIRNSRLQILYNTSHFLKILYKRCKINYKSR